MADIELVIRISEEKYKDIQGRDWKNGKKWFSEEWQAIHNGTPIPDNATNGDVIKAMFGYDKVSEFMGYVRIMARVGNWFNDGVVAEFDKDWWNASYEGSDTE